MESQDRNPKEPVRPVAMDTQEVMIADGQNVPMTSRQKMKGLLKKNLLVLLTLGGVIVGFIVGFSVNPSKPTASTLLWLGMPGELYIRMLKMMIVPLVVASVISGTASMDPKSNGKISGVCLGYIMVTNFIPAVFATILCVLMKPGEGLGINIGTNALAGQATETEDIFADLLRNIIPDNIVAACFRQAQTQVSVQTVNHTVNGTVTVQQTTSKHLGVADSTNILGLIVVSTVFGVATSVMKKDAEPFLNFFRSATNIVIKILRVLIWSTPVGVASLVAKTIAGTPNIEETFRKLGLYTLTVMISLIAWGFIAILVLFYIIRRTNPFRFLATIIHPIMITFATSSTVIALPDSFHSLEDKNGVDKRISRFVAPVSATIGRAGSAIYISTSCVFIIQLMNLEVHAGNVILIIILTTLSTLAIPSVTGASLITVLILLTALNIPGEAAAILFALEWFLDRARSVVNLITQLTGAVLVDRLCKSALAADTDTNEMDIADGQFSGQMATGDFSPVTSPSPNDIELRNDVITTKA